MNDLDAPTGIIHACLVGLIILVATILIAIIL